MKVGVMGGGQLGQMLALAAPRAGCTIRFISPDPQSPAGLVAELIIADYENEEALAHFIDGLDVVTYEFESIPSGPVRSIEDRVPVRPSTKALETAADIYAFMLFNMGVDVKPPPGKTNGQTLGSAEPM